MTRSKAMAEYLNRMQEYGVIPSRMHTQKTPRAPRTRTPRTSIASRQPQALARRVYETLQDRGLFIAPELDIKFGAQEVIDLNENGSEQAVLAAEQYNSSLLFSMLTAICDNSMIFFGPPGAGKTTSSEFVSSAVFGLPLSSIQEATIYGHPELSEEKMTARYDIADLMRGKESVRTRKFMQSPIKIIDEVNRIPPGKLSILYQIVDRGWTTYGSQRISSMKGPLYATANAADSGNYAMPPPFLDRFDIGVTTNNLNPYFIDAIGKNEVNLETLTLTEEERKLARQQIGAVEFDPEALARVVHFLAELNYCDRAGTTIETKTKAHCSAKKPGPLCSDCSHYCNEHNICKNTENGLSVRSYKSILSFAKAVAWWRGNNIAGKEEFDAVIPYATWFKLTPTRQGLEHNDVFINDRVNFVREMMDVSNRSFTEVQQNVPEYCDISTVVSDFYTGTPVRHTRDELKDMINSVRSIDSPAKYGLTIALSYLAYKSGGTK